MPLAPGQPAEHAHGEPYCTEAGDSRARELPADEGAELDAGGTKTSSERSGRELAKATRRSLLLHGVQSGCASTLSRSNRAMTEELLRIRSRPGLEDGPQVAGTVNLDLLHARSKTKLSEVITRWRPHVELDDET